MPFRLALTLSAVLMASAVLLAFSRPSEIPFQRHTLDLGPGESCAVADINGDGKLDIVSGEYWYEAPNWTPHHFRDLLFTSNYIDDLSTVPLDVDRDGRVDLVTVSWFGKKIAWWRNPGPRNQLWQEHVVDSGWPVEFALLVDLTGSGKKDAVLPEFGDEKAPLAWYDPDGRGGLQKHVASPRSYGHGIGAGDVNGDGRPDILTPNGWLEAPRDPNSANWEFHPDWKLGDTGFLYTADVNGDGRMDIIGSMAHNYGIFWLEQKADRSFEKHLIDDSWSQSHALTIADLRGGINIGIVTGKRFMAHNGHDPGAHEPLGVYWYERLLDPATHQVEWAKHVIDYGGRVGGGLQIPVVDLDGDGDLDFVVAGKSGLFLFENKSR